MSRPLALGIVQLGPSRDGRTIWDHLQGLTATAFESGADVVLLPEMAYPGYSVDRAWLRGRAQSVPGDVVEGWTELAAKFGGYVCGGLCEGVDDKLFNSAVMVGPEGVLLHYRKLHLFSDERASFTPGDLGLPTLSLPFGKVGICICYDLRFIEVVRSLALRGAEIVLVPTAWVPGFDVEFWDEGGFCPQARGALLQANLNQCFIACASLAGKRGSFEFLGSSVVANPYGHLPLGPMSGGDEEVAVVTVDLDQVAESQVRAGGISPRRDRRTDVYKLVVDGESL